MKNFRFLIILTTICQMARGQSVPALINYQGRLTDQTGAPLASGNYSLEFRLWDSPTRTNLIWGQRQNVAVQANGVFNVILGAPGASPVTNPTPAVNDLSFAFGAPNRFLGVTTVSSNGIPQAADEIVPRQQLLSVPFALSAAFAAHRFVGTNVGIGGLALSPPCLRQTFYKTDGRVNITNLVVTLSTSGRPVFVSLVPAKPDPVGPLSDASCWLEASGTNRAIVYWEIFDETGLQMRFEEYIAGAAGTSVSIEWSPSSISAILFPPAGEHTYRLRAFIPNEPVVYWRGDINRVRLLAYEM